VSHKLEAGGDIRVERLASQCDDLSCVVVNDDRTPAANFGDRALHVDDAGRIAKIRPHGRNRHRASDPHINRNSTDIVFSSDPTTGIVVAEMRRGRLAVCATATGARDQSF
jgi:hypothetical protein